MRMAVFAEQLEIIHMQWSRGAFRLPRPALHTERCEPLPLPLQRPHPPIVVGGSGGRGTVDAAVRFAEEYNAPYLSPEDCDMPRKLVAGCERAARDQPRSPSR